MRRIRPAIRFGFPGSIRRFDRDVLRAALAAQTVILAAYNLAADAAG